MENSDLICQFCSYINSSQATKCEICETPLKQIAQNNIQSKTLAIFPTQIPKFSSVSDGIKLLLIVLAILGSWGIALFFVEFYIEQKLSATPSVVLSERGDIKLYETMKEVPNVPSGLYNYGGGICFAALQRDGMNDAIESAHSQFRWRYVEPKFSNSGCTTRIEMLLNGELSWAQNSQPLSERQIDSAAARGFELESIPVAIDGIVFYTNKSLGIKSLSIEQVRDIYRGKVNNWQELGGANLPIVPVSLDPEIDNILRLLTKTKHTPRMTKDAVIVRDYTSAIRKTVATEGAISYASAAILRGQSSVATIALAADSNGVAVSALLADGTVNLQAFESNLYPLTRKLFVTIRRDGNLEERAGVAYVNLLLSQEGQKIVEKSGIRTVIKKLLAIWV